MRIVVTSNCQTGGLTTALRMLLPDAQVSPFPYAGLSDSDRVQLLRCLTEADLWIVTCPPSFREGVEQEISLDSVRVVTLPELYFDAFHPDLVYAWLPDNTTLDTPAGPYNSAIALWAWRRSLDPADAVRLFSPQTFAQLGYTDRWVSATARFETDFKAHGLDYRNFLLPLQRRGVFMHTVNHPKVAALAQLSRMVAERLGCDEDLLNEPIEDFMTDGLMAASTVWPVYPGIADSLGLTGGYTWKLPDQSVIRLDDFIHRSFEMYARASSRDVACHQLDWPMYDPVLTAATSGAFA